MNEQENNIENEDLLNLDGDIETLSSSAMIRTKEEVIEAGTQPPRFLVDAGLLEEAEEKEDPIFRELAEPQLPELERENRAKLLMQTPNRLYFYWSIKNNPYRTLHRVLQGKTGSYRLVAKIVNQKSELERIFPIETEGGWWFSVEPNASYRAEVGFYATNRPYIRIIFSNAVETPRRSPSSRIATDADFAVSAQEFAEVLDVAGFKQDAFEVALIGDDRDRAETATRDAFAMLANAAPEEFAATESDELRFAMLAVASGVAPKDLREHLSPALFATLQSLKDEPTAERAISALSEHFDVFTGEMFAEDEEFGAAVYGASLVNFPKTLKKRVVPRFGDKLFPLSS